MSLVDGQPNLQKVNTLRAALGQPMAQTEGDAGLYVFCSNLFELTVPRLTLFFRELIDSPSPNILLADSLYSYLAFRLNVTWENLNCSVRICLEFF